MKQTFRIAGQIEVNRMGYGGMQLTGAGVFGDAVDRSGAIKVLQTAVELGVNFIDTADSYGPHTNETLIADALAPFSEKKLTIATKSGLTRPGPGEWRVNGDPSYIASAIEGCLQRLRVPALELWQLHRVDSNFAIEKTLEPVVKAVNVGKIKHVGLSEVNVDQIKRAQKVLPIASVQNHYNLENREWDSVVDYCAANGIAFIPWYPLANGPDKFSSALTKAATAHSASKAQIALAWLLKRADNILLIPGTKSVAHLRENIGAREIELSDAEFAALS